MTKEEFFNLKEDTYVYCNEPIYETAVVRFGPWQNVFRDDLKGSGFYLEFDDGDRSRVGFEHFTDAEIEKFIKSDIKFT